MTDGRQKQTLRIASASIAAILEKHKEGMSNTAISKLFAMSGPTAVARVLEKVEGSQNPNLGKCDPQSSTAAVPMASTEDRSDTREDARS